MMTLRTAGALAGLVCLLFAFAHSIQGDDSARPTPERSAPIPLDMPDDLPEPIPDVVTVEAVVLNAFQTANVGSQVSGIVDAYHFEEGDLIRQGQVVAEISSERYRLNLERIQERLHGLEVAAKRLGEEARIKTELFDLNAISRQELVKAETEAEITRYRVAETKRELDLARLDLAGCKVTAPFTGYLATRYKQPNEPVERLEKIFLLVDSSRVFAIANVPESLLSEFRKSTEAVFVYSREKRFKAKVDHFGKLIDPKSRTKRVYLLIDNKDSGLEVGMTGTLRLVK